MGYRLNRLDEPVFMAGPNLCGLSLTFILDWRVVIGKHEMLLTFSAGPSILRSPRYQVICAGGLDP